MLYHIEQSLIDSLYKRFFDLQSIYQTILDFWQDHCETGFWDGFNIAKTGPQWLNGGPETLKDPEGVFPFKLVNKMIVFASPVA